MAPVTRKRLQDADREKAHSILMKPHEEPCFICSCAMDSEAPPCCISGCHHIVCSICIKEWGKSSNRCPFCRARFSVVFYLENGHIQETKFKTKNDVEYDYDIESTSAEATFSCSVCTGTQHIASMVMCSSRDCSYTAHGSCLQKLRIPIGDESTFKCPAHRVGSEYERHVSNSTPRESRTTDELPETVSTASMSAPVDPFATRVVRKPNFLQQTPQSDRPYYLDLHCDDDTRTGIAELKRRRTEAAVTRSRRESTRPQLMVSTGPRLSDNDLFNKIYSSTISAYERRLSAHSAAPEFDAFGNIMSQKSERRKLSEAAAEESARRVAEQAAKAAVKARADTERGLELVRAEREQFLKQQREAVALEKLRALIASKRAL